MIIPYSEIKELSNGCYIDVGDEILVKHSVYTGERDFALVLIEKCLGLLGREEINDNFIVQYLQGLLAITLPGNTHYIDFLDTFVKDEKKVNEAMQGEKLHANDIAVIKELMQTNMAEYTMKGEYQRCCYSAIVAFFLTAYCILMKNIDLDIGQIDMIADLDDELDSIQIYQKKKDMILLL